MLASSATLSLLILLLRLIQAHTLTTTNGTANPLFPALIVFGDSIVDTGNNNMLPTLSRCDFPPYGRDFVNHQPNGRFTNGKVPSDMIASKLGLGELLPPYLGRHKSEDLLTGVSFASGGTGYDNLTAEVLLVLSMSDQLKLFKDYKEILKTVAEEERVVKIVSDSLYIVCAGSNDIANTFFGTHMRKFEYNFTSYDDFLVRSATSFVEELYHLGARKIGVFSLPPLGCLPSQRTLAGGFQRGCVALYNQASQKYNYQLEMELGRLGKKYPGTKIIYINIYDSLLDIMLHPSNYGFEESTKGCCGTGELEVSILCNKFSINTCADDTKYVFWDSFHPTEKAYEIISSQLFEKYIPLLV